MATTSQVGDHQVCGAEVEATLELWALSLRGAKAWMRPLFHQGWMTVSAGLFLDGLLGEERRRPAGYEPQRPAIPVRFYYRLLKAVYPLSAKCCQ